MVYTYDIFYDRWRSCTISYTFGAKPEYLAVYPITLRHFVSIVNNTMPQYCCVHGCNNFGGHRFPNEKKLNKKWRVAIKRVDATKQLYGHHKFKHIKKQLILIFLYISTKNKS